MKYHAKVYVSLKKGYSDPEGEATASALQGLGYSVSRWTRCAAGS
jgi:phosphoribosylformylglycinamidine (FGAM) synthase PurS component